MPVRGTTLLITAALIIIAAGLKAAEAVVVPFMLAVFIATIAATPVFWMERYRIPSAIAITLVMLSMVAILVGIGALVAQAVPEFTAKQGEYTARLEEWSDSGLALLGRIGVAVPENVFEDFDPGTAWAMAGNTLRGLGSVLSNGLLILLTTLFILAEASSFPRKLGDVLEDPDNIRYFAKFATDVNRYMAIKTTVSLATGVVVGISLAVIGVDFPVLWATLAFLLNYVPNIGSFIAAVPAVLLALVQLGPLSAVATAGVYVAVNMIMGNLVEPRFMGKELGLSTLVVFLSLVFWGWMFGPVGMLLSVPLTMTAKIALEANPGTHWLAHLLGPADPDVPDEPITEMVEAEEGEGDLGEGPPAVGSAEP